MAEAMHTELPRTGRSMNRRLLFAVLAPPIAWFVHEVTGLAIAGRSCTGGEPLGAWQWTALVAVSIVAAAIAAAGAFIGYRLLRQRGNGGRILEAEGWDRVEFVSLMALFLSTFLLLNIIYFGVMPFIVNPCMRAI